MEKVSDGSGTDVRMMKMMIKLLIGVLQANKIAVPPEAIAFTEDVPQSAATAAHSGPKPADAKSSGKTKAADPVKAQTRVGKGKGNPKKDADGWVEVTRESLAKKAQKRRATDEVQIEVQENRTCFSIWTSLHSHLSQIVLKPSYLLDSFLK